LKTAPEIVASISQEIAHIYLRPSMHVGQTDASYSAHSMDSLLWHLHFTWADAQNLAKEFRKIADDQRHAANCSALGFADAFYHLNDDATHADAFRFVMSNWREISVKLEMPLDDGNGRNAMEAEF